MVTSEPSSVVSPSHQRRIDHETNEGSLPEMAALFRRETNITSNYLMAMAFAGMVAAAGLWTDTVHIAAAAAYLLLTLFQPSSMELSGDEWVRYWSSFQPASSIVALAASAAGAAIIAAQRSVLTAGVMIALALVPSAAIVGMAVAAGDFALAGKGLTRWAIDAGCVAVGGGVVFLLKRRNLHRKGTPARAAASR